jgi:hypothetical protein
MINVIREYIACQNDPLPRWPEMEFDKTSYSRWAATEVLVHVLSHPEWTVIRSVEDINDRFLKYACDTFHISEANFIFEIAHETASNILDILYAMV